MKIIKTTNTVLRRLSTGRPMTVQDSLMKMSTISSHMVGSNSLEYGEFRSP